MGQLVGCLDGMGQACRALDFPIVSGNVSLYNESKATGGGSAILPTPAIGGVGVIEDLSKAVGIEIGRASCRERVCQYVYVSVVAVSLNKTSVLTHTTNN